MAMLDATGITVDLRDLSDRKRFGSARWTLPMGGGKMRDGNVIVEVRPTVDMSTERWRDYDELERIADEAERNGGFARAGDEIVVGDHIIVGRDALDLLTVLWKRAGEREGDKDTAEAAYRQGYNAAQREVRQKVRNLANSISDRYPDET